MNRREVTNSIRTALSEVGFDSALIRRDYAFADFAGSESEVLQVPLAAFSSYPCTYRNACAALVFSNAYDDSERLVFGHRSLGAPLLFESRGDLIQPWAVGRENAKPIGHAFPTSSISDKFHEYRKSWNPQVLGRVKTPGQVRPNRQLDLFDAGLLPVLSEFFQSKLKDLLERAFVSTAACYETVHGSQPSIAYLFPYLFRFVTAKIFMDRADARGWNDLPSPLAVLQKAEAHSGSGLLDKLPQSFLRKEVLAEAWRSVSRTLHFQNLSVPDLAFVYESSFINDKTRRELGVHSTPLGLADYIVQHLPWERIPINERQVFEPFCGHGIFLASALNRLRDDLPPGLKPRQRHDYFRRMLIGVEKDPLAIEVCRLVLTLSDYPNSNRWHLYQDDVFTWSDWDTTLSSASVVLANPPYEGLSLEERRAASATKTTPPGEMLRRIMNDPPVMMGLVLPQSFLSSPFYQDANRAIAKNYDEVSIIELPRIFRYADNETIALIVSGRREGGCQVAVRYAEVLPGKTEAFFDDFHVSQQRTTKLAVPKDSEPFTLWVPRRGSLWERFADFDVLGNIADVRRGLQWIPRTDGKSRRDPRMDIASDLEMQGYRLGLEKMRGNLSQFKVESTRYLSLRREDQDANTAAHTHPWEKPKVVCNAARFERQSPWRLAAWADLRGLAFSQHFFAIWLDDNISEFAITAILCSPVANAFSKCNDLDRHNHISTLRKLPIPRIDLLSRSGELHNQCKRLQTYFASSQVSKHDEFIVKEMLKLDAAVLDAYELPDRLQRKLLDQFQGWKRPVRVRFSEYFPPHFKDIISLQNLVTIRFDWETTNGRRCDLIDKELSPNGLTSEERAELDQLQQLADSLVRLEAPYPNDKLDGLISQLRADGKWTDSI